jgi:hypothetical protein
MGPLIESSFSRNEKENSSIQVVVRIELSIRDDVMMIGITMVSVPC